MNVATSRIVYASLCAAPFVAAVLAAIRPLRIPGMHQAIGVVLFAAIAAAAWSVGGRALRGKAPEGRASALAGILLTIPFALVALFWVGLGTPWEATAAENYMRYFVLLAMSVAVTAGLVTFAETLRQSGERAYSSLGAALALLAGAAYLVWLAFQIGLYAAKLRSGSVDPALTAMSAVFDLLLFVAGLLTYLATAGFAIASVRVGWFGRVASRVYLTVNLVLALFLILRGAAFVTPGELSAPWFASPGFIAGIPAIPWIMPALMGAVLLRKAGAASASE